jgi:hypothetical protein
MPGRRVAILVRAKGTTRWRTYAYAITNRTGFVGLRIALRSGTEFAVRYAGDSAHVGAQSVALVITVRADNVL